MRPPKSIKDRNSIFCYTLCICGSTVQHGINVFLKLDEDVLVFVSANIRAHDGFGGGGRATEEIKHGVPFLQTKTKEETNQFNRLGVGEYIFFEVLIYIACTCTGSSMFGENCIGGEYTSWSFA